MTAIWKFTLAIANMQDIEMPRGARILSIAQQHGKLCLWALVNPEADRVKRALRIAGTGHQCDARAAHFVGTVLCNDGLLVWHVFDYGEVS